MLGGGSLVAGTLGALALVLATPAVADPDPGPPPPAADAPLLPDSPAPAGADALALAAEGVAPTPVPHLSSLENLPPGTSIAPVGPTQGRGMSYLRDIWHAMQTQDVTMNEAIFLLTQRPMNPDAAPPQGLPAGPQIPPAPLADAAPPAPVVP